MSVVTIQDSPGQFRMSQTDDRKTFSEIMKSLILATSHGILYT